MKSDHKFWIIPPKRERKNWKWLDWFSYLSIVVTYCVTFVPGFLSITEFVEKRFVEIGHDYLIKTLEDERQKKNWTQMGTDLQKLKDLAEDDEYNFYKGEFLIGNPNILSEDGNGPDSFIEKIERKDLYQRAILDRYFYYRQRIKDQSLLSDKLTYLVGCLDQRAFHGPEYYFIKMNLLVTKNDIRKFEDFMESLEFTFPFLQREGIFRGNTLNVDISAGGMNPDLFGAACFLYYESAKLAILNHFEVAKNKERLMRLFTGSSAQMFLWAGSVYLRVGVSGVDYFRDEMKLIEEMKT